MDKSSSPQARIQALEQRAKYWQRELIGFNVQERATLAQLLGDLLEYANGWREKWINDKDIRDTRIAELEAALTAKEQEIAAACDYLSRLLRYYAPKCEPLTDLDGICSQVDNLLVGLQAQLTATAAEAVAREQTIRSGFLSRLTALDSELAACRQARDEQERRAFEFGFCAARSEWFDSFASGQFRSFQDKMQEAWAIHKRQERSDV